MTLDLHCVVCTAPIEEQRALRGGRTCSNECKRELSRRIRSRRSQINCRLCGRRARKQSNLGAVPQQHKWLKEIVDSTLLGMG